MSINRIVLHHSGGGYTPSSADEKAYHRLVHGNGIVTDGKFPISANAAGRVLKTGTYAAHCLNLNSGAIGLALCCMADGVWSSPLSAKYFPKPEQVDAAIEEAARLAVQYGIQPTRREILTHAEVEITLGVAQRSKWDFDYDPLRQISSRDPIAIGDELRRRIQAAMQRLGGAVDAVQVDPAPDMPVIRQGASGDAVATLQRILGLTQDKLFGPLTRKAVEAFQRKHQLMPDGIVGRNTWAALLAPK